MRFEEAYRGWQSSRLTQEEAARLLGVCERTFRRYIDRYEDEGLEGLIDKWLSQVSHRRAPGQTKCCGWWTVIGAGMKGGAPSTFMPGTAATAARGATARGATVG